MTAPAAPCNRQPFLGRVVGPTVGAPSFELAVNGRDQLARAVLDVATWPDRVRQRAAAIAAAQQSAVQP